MTVSIFTISINRALPLSTLGDVGGYRCAASEQLISELARTPRNSFDDPQRKLGELRQNCKCRS